MAEAESVERLLTILEVTLVRRRKNYFPNVIKIMYFEILLPKNTPIILEIIYRLPSQINVLKTSNMTFEKLDVDKKRYRLPSQINFLKISNMTFEKPDVDKKEMYTPSKLNMYHNNVS